MRRPPNSAVHWLAIVAIALGVPAAAAAATRTATDSAAFVRINQLGYRLDSPKVAVVCALRSVELPRFTVEDAAGRRVLGPLRARRDAAFGPCVATWRLDFSALRAAGTYRVRVGAFESPLFPVRDDVYAGLADTLLGYLRQQRSGYNPFLRDSAHKFDGRIVDHPTRTGEFIDVAGGWADAADYLQYVTTSATATYHLLSAWRDAPHAFRDAYDARGLPGGNDVPDVLDEARHGLAWLLKMHPDDSTLFNQLGDDRDHVYLDLITTDSSDYGWGKGKDRPVYPCTGKPQGLLRHKNRSTGFASTAGKMAAAFALGAQTFAGRDSVFAARLAGKARSAYALGRRYPGVCQTAPASAPYFYEEESWADDMELGASLLHDLTGERGLLAEALEYARQEPVTPWMGADTARHYQWYPWHNAGHYEAWRRAGEKERRELAAYYREGLARVVARAGNGFRVGIPFIWCSNDLLVSFATQAGFYREMTGDTRFRSYEQAALDWLFGANPWGTSMVIGIPRSGVSARAPHTELPDSLLHGITGGLLDGPVYRSIFENLRGIRLLEPDEYAAFNVGSVVYHDDWGDYSTNEHIMDGTASLLYLLTRAEPAPDRAGFTSSGAFGERTRVLTLDPGVTATIVAPAKLDLRRRIDLILYALPNGNTTAETMGRALGEDVGWRYDIQHIAAQTRALRQRGLPQAVVVYLEAEGRSWPAWRAKHGHASANARIVAIVDELRAAIGNAHDLAVTLAGHSGGGSFMLGFIDGRAALPAWLDRVAFLDANYSVEPRHGEKLAAWARGGRQRTLVVLAYDDREITLDGKKVVSDSGGTWRATERMLRHLSSALPFTHDTLGDFLRARAPGVELLRHPNPANRILHTEMIGEMNGYMHALLTGRAGYDAGASVLRPERAYGRFVLP